MLPLFPWTTIAGCVAVVAIVISTWWVPGMRIALEAGIPWLFLLTALYFMWGRTYRKRSELRAISRENGPEAAD
jgi:L-asparagine transporter-like permease